MESGESPFVVSVVWDGQCWKQ